MAKTPAKQHAAPAGFVFRGTVQRVKATTVTGVKAAANTAVVRVDEVIAAPAVLARTAGRDITAVAGHGVSPFTRGQRAVFHTSSLSFGQEIAVRVARIERITSALPVAGMTAARAAAAPLAAAHASVVDPIEAHRDLRLKRSLDRADVIVAGTVSDVRLAPDTRAQAIAAATVAPLSMTGVRATSRRRTAAGTSALAGALTPSHISEHDPIWHEAVVDVDSVEKGKTTRKQVVVRFPSSNDVRWKDHPKLKPGQQGIFLLSTAEAGGSTRKPSGTARGRRSAAGFTTASSPAVASPSLSAMAEPEPISAIDKVRQLLQAPSGVTPATAVRRRRGGPRR